MQEFLQRIISLIYRGAMSAKKNRMILTLSGGIIFSSIVLSLILGSFYLDRFLGWPKFISKPFSTLFSLPFLIPGSLLWLWCVGKFFKTKGTPVPMNPPPKLITDGPYAYSRNPMMTGLFMVIVGIGILFGSITLTFIMTPLFVFMSILGFKYMEEPELEKRFGNEYREYKKRTPIIIPKIR